MLESISAFELERKTIEPIRWIVDGLIPQGLTILAGAPKAGKSWLALDLCLSVALGDPLWGRRVDPNVGDVVYLALEDSDRRLKDRMQKVLDGRKAPSNLYFITEAPPIDGGLFPQMEYLLDCQPNTSLIVIDTLGRIRQSSSRDGYQKDYAEMSALKHLADSQKHGCAVVAVHHLRKMRAFDPFDMISGTNGIMGAADTALVLQRSRQSTDGRLAITGRDLDEAEFALKFTEKCRWELISEDAKAYDFKNDPLVKFLTDLPAEDGIAFQGFAEELTIEYQGYCRKNKLKDGLTDIKPSIALSRKLNGISSELWRCRKKMTTQHTNRGTMIFISSL